MKDNFIACSGLPGSSDFCAIMFRMEAVSARTAQELEELAKACVREYALTDEGCMSYIGNCENFNWGDMLTETDNATFKAICKKRGLSIEVLGSVANMENTIDYDEQLMDDIPVCASGIHWDTDGEEIDLPETVNLVLDSPLTDVADTISDKYGWCIESIDTVHCAVSMECPDQFFHTDEDVQTNSETSDNATADERFIFLYKEYNDDLAYGEEYLKAFQDKEAAISFLKQRVRESYGTMLAEEQENPDNDDILDALRKVPEFSEDSLDDDCVSIVNDGGDTSYFIVEKIMIL